MSGEISATQLYGADLAVRPEVATAHASLLMHATSAGEWWSAEERAAISQQVRAAQTAEPLAPWVSPSSVDGLIEPGPLSVGVVDAIWRITNHPGTLTAEWHAEVLASGVEPAAYVELAALVSMVVSLDTFALAVGRATLALPTAAADEAPAVGSTTDAGVADHWVPTVANDELPNVRKALTAVPLAFQMQGEILEAQYVPGGALAVPLDEDIWSLNRLQVELVATRVSNMNECFY